MDVSVVIVNYNTCFLLLQCLNSIYQIVEGIDFEVIVVDNASSDNSIQSVKDKFPQVILIENSENIGFGRANNLGVKYACGKYLFFLNSDTILINNSIKQFYEAMEKVPLVAACGGNLLDGNGLATYSYGFFPNLLQEIFDCGLKFVFPSFYFYKLSINKVVQSETIPFEVDYICGADIFVRKSIFKQMGGFDEAYFMFYEETDLFFRMKKKCFVSKIFPDINMIHLGGASFQSNSNISKLIIMYKSKILFYKKSYSYFILVLLKTLMIVSSLVHVRRYRGHVMNIVNTIIKS
ncbi:glycosyltransferase family 2 protein [Bacteroides sp.]|uniref:glycosyltransferase family 2 protein n=1 Tax=Bacteroides sp. TaxID=29523 RepID=UPI004029FC0D